MRIVIVEDEPAAARQLKKMLGKVDGLSIGSLSICSTAGEARERLRSGLDLLFLDLNIQGESGMEIARKFLVEPFETIITTAYPEHALKAFEMGALDYLVKPFSQERLEQAVARIRSGAVGEGERIKKILIKERGKIFAVDVESIVLIRSAGDYSELFSNDGSSCLCSKRMDYLERKLPADFARAHRTAIVRVSKVSSLNVEGGGKYSATLKGIANRTPVGRKYYKGLKAKLGSE